MKIAITGSTGFIGTALIKCLYNKNLLKLFPFDKTIHSLSSIESLQDFVMDKDVIIHLAGITNTQNKTDYTINSLGTLHLLEAISLYGKKRVKFIFLSTFAVYEELTSPMLLDENKTKTIPHDMYGKSKLSAEEHIINYSQKKQINAYILRVANVYGPGMKETTRSVIYNIIKSIQTHMPITVNGNGKQMRDFIYIDDIIQAISKCIYDSSHKLLVVNICSSKETDIISVIKNIEKILGKTAEIHFNKNYKEKGYWIGNNTNAWRELGFKPKVMLNDGLKKTIQWYSKMVHNI